MSARVITVPGPSGPAVARNRAAAEATGEILVFVDADVVAAPDALSGMCGLLESNPAIAGVFGAYDRNPPEPNFMSQYKNLSHACVHESGSPEAFTFWAGLGAIRTAAFRQVHGFDERFHRPSVEDIDLGYRVRKAGHRLRLDPAFRGTHLKRWTLWNSIVTELRARGIPWTQLIHRYGSLTNDLNTGHTHRLSVVLTYVFIAATIAAFFWPLALGLSAAAVLGLVLLNFDYYRWFVRHRGVGFALAVLPAHLVHHACNGVSFVTGTCLYAAKRAGLALPGALPLTDWHR